MIRASQLSSKGRTRREQILKKAALEFADRGYHATTVANILEGMGIARGTFYQYFANKRAIFDEILDGLLAKISAGIHVIDVTHPERSPREQLRNNIVRVFENVLADKAMTRVLLMGATGVDREFDRKIHEFYALCGSLIERSLRRGLEMGVLRPINFRLVTACVLGCMKELVNQAIENEDDDFRIEEATEQLIDTIARGIFADGQFLA